MKELRTFDHFPSEKKCPICGTSEDSKCVLIPIDGTCEGRTCEAEPVHLACAIPTNYNKKMGFMYLRTMENREREIIHTKE